MSKDFGLFFHLLKPESWDNKVRPTERWDLQWGEIYSEVKSTAKCDQQQGEIYSEVRPTTKWTLHEGEIYSSQQWI